MIDTKELHEILEYYKAGYHNEYANKDIIKLVEEIFKYQKMLGSGTAPKKVKKIKKT